MSDINSILDNRYELLEELGAGGMGVVYKAKDPLLNIIVAVKMLHTVTPQQFLRFQQEAKAAGRMNHRNLVKILTFGISDDKPYMVMEYVTGKDLAQILAEEGAMQWRKAIPIFVQVCEALAHAHGKGVLHRDLKTSNVMLVEEAGSDLAVVKILDFGISKLFSQDAQDHTKPGQLIGSPLYMSPEQIVGRKIDGRSDIYSMGCLMYATLTGHTPFVGESVLSVLSKHTSDKPPTLADNAKAGTEFPQALEDIVAKTLSKAPASRFQTMERLGNSLRIVDRQLPGLPSRTIPESGTHSAKLVAASAAITAILLSIVGYVDFRSLTQQKVPEVTPVKFRIAPSEGVFPTSFTKVDMGGRWQDVYANFTSGEQLSGDDIKTGCRDIKNIQGFTFEGNTLEKSAIPVIASYGQLKLLQVHDTGIDDDDLRSLSVLKDLTFLQIAGCKIRDFSILPKFKKLVLLNVGRTDFGDSDVDYILTMPDLIVLGLNQTKITDVGIKKLAKLHYLDTLTLQDCDVSTSAINKLKKKLPSLNHISLQKTNIEQMHEISDRRSARHIKKMEARRQGFKSIFEP